MEVGNWIVVLKSGAKIEVRGAPDRKDGKLLFELGSTLAAMFDMEEVVAFYPAPK